MYNSHDKEPPPATKESKTANKELIKSSGRKKAVQDAKEETQLSPSVNGPRNEADGRSSSSSKASSTSMDRNDKKERGNLKSASVKERSVNISRAKNSDQEHAVGIKKALKTKLAPKTVPDNTPLAGERTSEAVDGNAFSSTKRSFDMADKSASIAGKNAPETATGNASSSVIRASERINDATTSTASHNMSSALASETSDNNDRSQGQGAPEESPVSKALGMRDGRTDTVRDSEEQSKGRGGCEQTPRCFNRVRFSSSLQVMEPLSNNYHSPSTSTASEVSHLY